MCKGKGAINIRKSEIGYCHICGSYGELTYEHIPPEAALNKNKAIIYTGDNVIKRYKGEKSKYISRQQGMDKFSLCKECNSKTGSWYAAQYSDVAKEVALGLYKMKPLNHSEVVEQLFRDFPALPFIKQVITMLCSLLPIDEVKRLGFDKLLLKQDSNIVDTSLFDLRIYLTPLNVGQLMVGPASVCVKKDDGIEVKEVVDLGAYPFGFILNLTPQYPINYGTSIMNFLEAKYDKVYNMTWKLMYLERTSDVLPLPLVFKPLPEIQVLDCEGITVSEINNSTPHP